MQDQFTSNNVNGFIAGEVAALNNAHARIMADLPATIPDDLREQAAKSIADRLLNLWLPGSCATSLYDAYYD